jgi:hypothetical protein
MTVRPLTVVRQENAALANQHKHENIPYETAERSRNQNIGGNQVEQAASAA